MNLSAVSVAILFVAWLPSNSVANSISIPDQASLDQSFEPDRPLTFILGFSSTSGSFEQTFTVGVSGWLTHVELIMRSGVKGSLEPLVDVSVNRVIDGSPSFLSDDVLTQASAFIHTSADEVNLKSSRRTFDWIKFDLLDIPVSEGEVLAIVVSSSFGHGFHLGSKFGGGGYSQGQGSTNGRVDRQVKWQKDHYFRTYVKLIPEPSSALLVYLCLIAMSDCMARTGRGI